MAESESLNTMFQNSFAKVSDGNYALKTTGSTGSTQSVSISQTDPNNRVATIPNPAANTTSVTDTATVTSPGAGAAIATTAQLAAGTWDIEAITFIGGTTVASLEATNMRLLVGAAAIGRIMNPVPGTSGGIGTGQLRVRYVLAAPATASIIAVAAGTSGSVYSASIVAKRVI
jgi:hypothetical protein